MGYKLKRLNVIKYAAGETDKERLLSSGYELVEEGGENSDKEPASKSKAGGRAAKNGGGENGD